MDSGLLTLYVATGLDGFLADDDGGVGWLNEFEQAANSDTVDAYEEFFASVDCLVMGVRTYDHVWLVGGAQLAQEFLRAGQLDELRLSIVPVLLGSGISLFAGEGENQRLDLLDTTRYSSGIVELHYTLPT